MNDDEFAGEGRDVTGKVKETAGDVTGNSSLQVEGLGDQLAGKVQKIVGATRDAVSPDGEPLAGRARRFVRERPWATAALAGVLGIALINTLRGKR